MVVGVRHTGLSVSRTASLLGFSWSTVSHAYQEWSTTQRTSSQLTQLWEALESTWASIPVKCFRHLVQSMPRRIEAVLRAKAGVQLNIRKVFLMFGTLSVLLYCIVPASLSHFSSRGFSLHMFLKLRLRASKREMVVWLKSFPYSFPIARPTSPWYTHTHSEYIWIWLWQTFKL
jgi:hypothetical protein